jgi:lipopolysaccharide export system permease protein
MSILTKYLAREIIKNCCIVLAVVAVIYLAVDFFENIDDFLEVGVSIVPALGFFIFKIPFIITQVLPVGLLLAILISFGIMSKRNELIALKTSGVSIFHLFKPVATLGILSTLLLFYFSEFVVPATMARANRIYLRDVEKVSALATPEKNIWIKGDHAIFNIAQYDPVNRVMYGFSAHYMDDRFELIKRLDAEQGHFKENQWVFENLLSQEINPATGEPDISFDDRKALTIELLPDNLKQVAKSSDTMSFQALRSLIRKVEAEGYDATRYRVDLHKKIAFPVVCLIMCFVGTGVAVRGRLKEGLPVIVSYGMAIAFLYYIVLSLCINMGYGEYLPPVVAAWAANILFLCGGGILLINAE